MKQQRKVKILATLGPASCEQETIQNLHEAGADLFRINMSHTSHAMMRELIARIRRVEKRRGRPIGILVDLQGPKPRIGEFEKGVADLEEGRGFTLDVDDRPGDAKRVHLPHAEILSAVKPGHRLLIDDGRLKLVAEECDGESILCKVVSGGKIADRKGVSLPDTALPPGSLGEKDRADLDAALANGQVDWLALSFIQRPQDIIGMSEIVRGRVAIMAKIEKPQAVQRLDEIVQLADAVMIARGDLGVELPLEAVPGIQKQIIRACRLAGKPVVVATQMLESMVQAPIPTRAEVSDVANAVYEGADAIMLSAESASGAYPVEAVSMMGSSAWRVELDPNYPAIMDAQRPPPEPTQADAISLAVRRIAETLNLTAIVCYTASGATGIRTSRERPPTPILALSPIVETARRLSVAWGLHCVVTPDASGLEDMVARASLATREQGFGKPGDRIIISAGVPFGTPGATNMVRIAGIDGDDGAGAITP
ncbi:MAG: pyruvate kinase [Hyphomicrobiales bacterium]